MSAWRCDQVCLAVLTEDAVRTSELEGERLSVDSARSPIARWRHWAALALNERQVKLLKRLLDGFDGRLTSSKWAAIAKCSPDTALRDINDLLARQVLRKSDGGGRSTSYELNDPSR